MNFRQKKLRQAGDTIVEVVIATVLTSTVLVGAYSVTQKSTVGVSDSQEHSEVLNILQGQVELVRSQAVEQQADGSIYNPTSTFFCMDGKDPANHNIVNLPNLGSALPSLNNDNFTKYGSGPPCAAVSGLYNVAISYDKPTEIFTFTGRWDRNGGGKDQEQIAYRIHPAEPLAQAQQAAAALNGSSAADVTYLPCNTDPVTGLCAVNPNPVYHWNVNRVNNSNNPGRTVLSCSWDWGDGSPLENRSCNFGDFNSHTYKAPATVKPYSADCGKYPYTLKLTLHLSDGTSPTKSSTSNLPECY